MSIVGLSICMDKSHMWVALTKAAIDLSLPILCCRECARNVTKKPLINAMNSLALNSRSRARILRWTRESFSLTAFS